MKKQDAIIVEDIKKFFKVYPDKNNSIKEKVLFFNRNRYEKRWVLEGVSFSIEKGEAVGLIGKNGCGKSTLLKLINKIIYPTSGKITVNGRISSLLELGAGFHPDMSGRENIYINASIFGLTKRQIDEKLEEIISFSELGNDIENPVRTYSSGMYMRLAFSVAINVEADILLIDEILAVGDVSFQKKCFEKLLELKQSGTTIIMVSHSLDQIQKICDKSIWIESGQVKENNHSKDVIGHYLKHMERERQERLKESEGEEHQEIKNTFNGRKVLRSGNGDVYFTGVLLYNESKEERIFSTGEYMRVEYTFENKKNIDNVMFSLRIYKDDNTNCFASNTLIENECMERIIEKKKLIVEFPALELLPGNYMLDVDVLDFSGELMDSIHDTIRFSVQYDKPKSGICNMKSVWRVE
ncbi:MAG: ABC transporter ATP-binding protein [Lachnospiraceae bacterium]|nr:ABC transporter ATP-binding protein [Lachnospiraceae bacterium]